MRQLSLKFFLNTFIYFFLFLNMILMAQTSREAVYYNPFVYSTADLSISANDIRLSKNETDIVTGDSITVSITVHNIGSSAAYNINCAVYGIDPDTSGVAPLIDYKVIGKIEANDSSAFSFPYTIPANPQYYKIVAKIDPQNLIHELNRTNNKAVKNIVLDAAKNPPLSVNVIAISSVALKEGSLTPNSVLIKFNISNKDTINITNVKVALTLYDGLVPASFLLTKDLGTLNKDTTVSSSFIIGVTKSSPGINRYSLTFTGDSIETKTVERIIFVPSINSLQAPKNFTGTVVDSSSISFTWDPNSEPNINGYLLLYSSDGINWNATGADQGNSPITIINKNSVTLSGLSSLNMSGTKYYFALKAFDIFGNTSSISSIIQLTLNNNKVSKRLSYIDGNPIKWVTSSANPPSASKISGYVAGTNQFRDIGKYEKFDSVGNVLITQAKIFFWKKDVIDAPDNFNFVIRSVGSDGAPDKLLYEKLFPTTDIDTERFGINGNLFNIDKSVVVNGSFFIGVEWDSTFNDRIGIIADTIGKGKNEKRAWEKWADGSFHAMNNVWNNGLFDSDLWIQAFVQTATGIKNLDEMIPNNFVLYQNYPNPFNPTTKIRFALPKSSNVRLVVYDILGKEITTLVDGQMNSGYHEVELKGTNLTSGIYLVRLTAGGYSSTIKAILMK